ncbi:MAG: 30S ribosomal protein S5 [Deltaproteobacteria bacterium]|nr:30S ribosomal protein S5 [Deltaproteobacteria bacterium]
MGISRDIVASLDLKERIVNVARVAKVVRGGRRFSFSALVAVGDEKNFVGFGLGKANEVPEAIAKATEQAKKNLIQVSLVGSSIPHEVVGQFGAAKLILRPASQGTGVIAGGATRVLLELAGVRDVLSKSIGTTNPHNLSRATIDALNQLRNPEERKALLSSAGTR